MGAGASGKRHRALRAARFNALALRRITQDAMPRKIDFILLIMQIRNNQLLNINILQINNRIHAISAVQGKDTVRILAADMMFSRLWKPRLREEHDDEGRRPDEGRPDRAGLTLPIPVVESKNREVLYKHARTHIERTKIGEFERYRRPFTTQIRSDFRALYPVLNPFFDQADRVSANVVRTALRMRAITFALFLFYIAMASWGLWRIASAPAPDLLAGLAWHALLLAPPVAGFIVVGLVRHSLLGEMRTKAGDFGGTFNGALHLLNNKASFALERVSDDEPTSEGCEQRAEEWTSVALWLFNLHGVYDRYVTTRSWIVQTRLEYLTHGARFLKLAVLAAAVVSFMLFAPLAAGFSLPAFLFFSAYYAAGLLIWDVLPGRGASNTLFADSFIGSISGRNLEEVFENHVNTKTARLVKKLRGLYYNALKAH
jgi:hypothetical protein